MRFTNILYPVDFSERCKAVAPFVNAEVKRHRAALTLVNIVEFPSFWYGTPEAPLVPDLNIGSMIEEAGQRLMQFATDCFPGVRARVVVEEGDPASSILDMARESGFDLIMMPTRGCGRFRAALLGSVTAKVLHDSDCAVWTAAHPEKPEYSSSPEWRKVVCAVDSAPDALRLILKAGEMASSYGAQVHLVHALPPQPGTRMEQYLSREFDAFLKDSARQAIGAMQKEAGTDFRLCIEAGDVASIVAEVARKDEADLVLIGRGGLSQFGGRLRTHVYSIIRDAPCPVLSI
jgi:nucleotide-binding universal stress UspA family protein